MLKVCSGPVMLFALLLGIAFNFLSQEGACVKGIDFSAKRILRIGVALLGLRISFEQVVALGLLPIVLVTISIALTVLIGIALAKTLGLRAHLGILTGGAVAICGASAALAIAAVLPRHEDSERDTIFTVVGVTALSTLAMILYPIIVDVMGLDFSQSGIFLGATIHDVAQVVGAGYMVSERTGDVATLVKLMRVAMLVPLVLLIIFGIRKQSSQSSEGTSLPVFLIGFVVCMILNSVGVVPETMRLVLVDASRWCLITAITALGMKTALGEVLAIGPKAVSLIVVETLFLAVLVLGVIKVI